ncbi:MAG: hypothetical protein ACREOB_07830 [Thermodesulfobacteriota bacterium]
MSTFYVTVKLEGDRNFQPEEFDNLHDAAKYLASVVGDFADDEDGEEIIKALVLVQQELEDLAIARESELDPDTELKWEVEDYRFELSWED